MSYQLKAGEEWRDGKLYGWTGAKCPYCKGTGATVIVNPCACCGGTGDEWGVMPEQPEATRNEKRQVSKIFSSMISVESTR